MKDLIIIIGTILLGCIIFTMIIGDHNSVKSASKNAMEKQIEIYQE